MATLPPLRVPKKTTGLQSQTGFIKLGELPGSSESAQQLQALTRDTGKMLAVCYISNFILKFVVRKKIAVYFLDSFRLVT